jgi:hypothetical protein
MWALTLPLPLLRGAAPAAHAAAPAAAAPPPPRPHLPAELLAAVAVHLTLRERCAAACTSRAWRTAATDDAGDGVGAPASARRHAALATEREQRAAAAAPALALARSAALPATPAAHAALARMPRLRRLRLAGRDPTLLLAALAAPLAGLEELELELTGALGGSSGSNPSGSTSTSGADVGAAWGEASLRAVVAALARGAPRLRRLILRCGDPGALGEDGAALEPLAALACLEHVAIGPLHAANEDGSNGGDKAAAAAATDAAAGCLVRPPAVLGALPALATAELALRDHARAPLVAQTFEGLAALPDVALALHAGAGGGWSGGSGGGAGEGALPRVVVDLPPRLCAVTGLRRLALDGFSFQVRGRVVPGGQLQRRPGRRRAPRRPVPDLPRPRSAPARRPPAQDAGPWSTSAAFDASPLAALPHLRALAVRLSTWGCEHADALEVLGLEALTRLSCLDVSVAGPPALRGMFGEAWPPGGVPAVYAGLQEVRLALPLPPASQPHELVGADGGGVDGALGARLEDVRLAAGGLLVVANCGALATATRVAALARGVVFEQAMGLRGGEGAGAADAPAAVRAPAAAVLAALPELWGGAAAWRVDAVVAGPPRGERWWWEAAERTVAVELLCKGVERGAALSELGDAVAQGLRSPLLRWGGSKFVTAGAAAPPRS